MESDYEKMPEGMGDGRIALVLVAVLMSVAAHVGMMVGFSDCAFAPLPGTVKSDRKWTRDLPTMQMQTMAGDPLAAEMVAAPPPPPPEVERPEDRVDRLGDATTQTILPDLPATVSDEVPKATPLPEPAAVAAAEWKPRQEIMAVELPTVPDEDAVLPRLVIPKVARVTHAADVTPPFELMPLAGESGASGGVVGSVPATPLAETVGGTGAPSAPLPPKIDLPSGGIGGTDGPFGFGGRAPAMTALAEIEQKAAAESAEKREKRASAPDLPKVPEVSPPAPPPNARVDERKVVKEKEAVRVLRDEQVPAGEPFEEHVRVGLGAWVDPSHPQFKYFRIRMSSRAEKPLPVVSKDIVFLVDASGSIANDRLRACRKAVSAALRQLNSGDRFNVVAFRDKFTYAFPEAAWKEVTAETLEHADRWLGRLTAHGQTDVFRTLRSVLTLPRDPARPVVALVVTDGEATSGLTRNAEIISRFSELNGGLISVYMYGVKDTANAYLMDMLTRGNRGGWARHEGMRWAAADGIPRLSKKFERPVLSDISVLFTASSRAETYPRLVTNLCEDEPIEIYGVCPADQKEVVFRMRGLNGSNVFENLFRLPFASAEKLDARVKKEWATRRLYALIAAYTVTPKAETLQDMRLFAKHYGIPIPYEKEIK